VSADGLCCNISTGTIDRHCSVLAVELIGHTLYALLTSLLTAGRTHQEIQRIINAPTASKLRNTGMQYVVVEGVSYN
jgi:hypothetical protein